jgi:mono/diheme cytochrome c family protein
MKHFSLLTAILFSSFLPAAQAASDVAPLLELYSSQGATAASAERGKQLWQATFRPQTGATERSCASCHTSDLSAAGKHEKTGKRIEPMFTSVNAERLTDIKKTEKWFKRNCLWTMNRECTAQEKADFVLFINQ